MSTPEAPALLYSPAERESMLVRMREIASRDEISGAELRDLCRLIVDRELETGETFEDFSWGNFDISLHGRGKPEIYLQSAGDNNFQIILLDGLSHSSGELARSREEDGAVRWYPGIHNSAYLEFLGRRVELGMDIDDGLGVEPLSPSEHAILAKTLLKALEIYEKVA